MSQPPRPHVNGLSPQQVGPGTKIIIRGERLGDNKADIIGLWICGEDCKPWIREIQNNKIVCYVGRNPHPEDREVVVHTQSGGQGTSAVRLTLTDSSPLINPLAEYPIWMEEVEQVPDVEDGGGTVSPRGVVGMQNMNLFGKSVAFRQCDDAEDFANSEPSSETFEPARYLLNYHRDLTLEELKNGAGHLRKQCGQHTDGNIQFVKDHLDVLLACHATLQEVHGSIEKEESKSEGGSLTGPLDTVLNSCSKCAEQLFSNILSKKDKADRIRNALNVLERFRFLFGLPDSIEENIERKEYDIVLNDYKKAKSLFTDTQVKVFQQVMHGVRGKIDTFCHQLQVRLLEPSCPIAEKKQLLKYLVEFDSSSSVGRDPAWACLQEQQRLVLNYMRNVAVEFQQKLLEFVDMAQRKAVRPDQFTLAGSDDNISPLLNQFVEDLCDAVTQSMPDYWTLSQAYLDGSLFPVVKKPVLAPQDCFASPPTTPLLGKDSPDFSRKSLAPAREAELHKMITEVMDLLNTLVQQYCVDMDFRLNSNKDLEYSHILANKAKSQWLPFSVKRVKICVEKLSMISVPKHCYSKTVGLTRELRNKCVRCLFENAEQNIQQLHTRENWQLSQEGGHTALPLIFQNIVLSLLSTVRDVMEDIKMQETIKRRGLKDDPIKLEIEDMFYSTLLAFVVCLEHLRNDKGARRSDQREGHLSRSTESLVSMNEVSEGLTFVKPEERLVKILGNCGHTMLNVIPKLLKTFKDDGYNTDETENRAIEKFGDLECSIFDKYVTNKEDFLFGDIQMFLDAKAFPWDDCYAPAGVRNYVQELALKLVMAQAEVHSVAQDVLHEIIAHLLDKITCEVVGMINQIDIFCNNGSMQAKLDLRACQMLFGEHMNTKSKTTVANVLACLPEVSTADEKRIDQLLEDFKEKNSVIFSCLQYKFKIQGGNMNTVGSFRESNGMIRRDLSQRRHRQQPSRG